MNILNIKLMSTVFVSAFVYISMFGCSTSDSAAYAPVLLKANLSAEGCLDGKQSKINTWSKRGDVWRQNTLSFTTAPDPAKNPLSANSVDKSQLTKDQRVRFDSGCDDAVELIVEKGGRVVGWEMSQKPVIGMYGAFSYASGCFGVHCSLAPSQGDLDEDGISDLSDRCFNTAAHVKVHRVGPYSGCSEGQVSDKELALHIKREGFALDEDYDEDGVQNGLDRCSNTARSSSVFPQGIWGGCAWGQKRDSDILSRVAKLAH